MAKIISDRLLLPKPYPNIDFFYGPYTSIEEAFENVGPDGDDIACIGLTVGIQPTPNDPIVEYWFKDACEEETDLVIKAPDLTGYAYDPNYVHTDNNYTTSEKTKLAGLENYDDTLITAALDNKVDKITGKGLSTEDYTTLEKTKLNGIENGAQVNVVETVKVNNTALTPDQNKAVNITVPTVTSDLTNDSGFIDNTVNDLTNYYTKTEVDSKVSAVYRYKGTVQTYANLPSSDLTVGDVYNIATADPTHDINAGDNVAWTGTEWDKLGGDIDLSVYYTSTQVDTLLDDKVNEPSSEGTRGQVLTTDGNGGRNWTTIETGESALEDLSDVNLTTPAAGDTLVYDDITSKWVNAPIDMSEYYTSDEVDGLLDDKVDKVSGKGLSTEDYTTAEKTKLAGIEDSADANVIETVKVNNTALTPEDKEVNINLYFSVSNENATMHIG